MEYRALKNGYKASLLGYGCMRFPTQADGKIDRAEAKRLLLKAYNEGVTYFDTAYPYHGGESEIVVGEVMSELPRDSYYLATKMPCWNVHVLEDAERIFNEQLSKLKTDYVDFYLLHALDAKKFDDMVKLGVVDLLAKYKEQGKIKNYGFSFHDGYDTFERIINYRDWDFCQIQFNYVDKDTQATMKGYELAKSKGIPLVIMEPVKGGSLASLPKDIIGRMDEFRPGLSAAAWALNWVGTFDNCKVILSGMTTMEQVEDNLNTFNNFKPLSEAEMAAMEEVNKEILARAKNGCTGCQYCMPCPAGVNIPRNFALWNTYHKYNNLGDLKWNWNQLEESAKPYSCIKCGKCENVCPQHLSIRNDLQAFGEEMKELLK